jgi:hypothetical protein
MTRKVVGVSFVGGFGNQLFQYAFARAYAESQNAMLLTPGWIGQRIFEISDPPLDYDLPHTGFDEIPTGRTNIILSGYFQSQAAINLMSRSRLKAWFRLKDEWQRRFTTRYLIAAHIRRGDYVGLSNIYCLISENSYVEACKKFDLNPTDITWIQEGSRQQAQDLIDMGMPFIDDFVSLMNANVILRANSSFSWWAATLSNGRILSPLVEDRTGMHDVEFIEGNWPRMVDARNCGMNITDLRLRD